MEKINIEYRAIDGLKPYKNNPRKNDGAVAAVAESIKEFGFKVPVIIDANGEIIAGHTRLKAAVKLGLTEVPCIRADDLTAKQVKAFRLADNKTAELAEWDLSALDLELADLDLSLDMSAFGFDLGVKGDVFGDEFNLKSGDKDPFQTMSITFSDEQAQTIKDAIAEMRKTKKYKEYGETSLNKNTNGNALYLVVAEWMTLKKLS
jgi:site-specific DNA-methyltransferase (adenine-specific)